MEKRIGGQMDKNQQATSRSILTLHISTENLTPQQQRLIKTINSILPELLLCGEEGDFFQATSEAMKTLGNLVRHSKFAMESESHIPYAIQALEMAVENLNDTLTERKKVILYDN